MGEHVPLTFVVHAGDALSGGSLAVAAAYREGLGGPKLFNAPPAGKFCFVLGLTLLAEGTVKNCNSQLWQVAWHP